MRTINAEFDGRVFVPSAKIELPVGTKVEVLVPAAREIGDDQDRAYFEKSFQILADQWRKETGMLSSLSSIVQHSAYQQIIAMGERVVPLLLIELRDRPAHWFEALTAITKQTPVATQERSDPKKAREAWLKWGKERGFID